MEIMAMWWFSVSRDEMPIVKENIQHNGRVTRYAVPLLPTKTYLCRRFGNT